MPLIKVYTLQCVNEWQNNNNDTSDYYLSGDLNGHNNSYNNSYDNSSNNDITTKDHLATTYVANNATDAEIL